MLTELNTKRRGPVPLAGQEFARAYAADTWHIMEDQVCWQVYTWKFNMVGVLSRLAWLLKN